MPPFWEPLRYRQRLSVLRDEHWDRLTGYRVADTVIKAGCIQTDLSSMVEMLFAVRSAPNLLLGFVLGAMTDQLDCSRVGLARALTSTGSPATMK